jgi:hypothetical protein
MRYVGDLDAVWVVVKVVLNDPGSWISGRLGEPGDCWDGTTGTGGGDVKDVVDLVESEAVQVPGCDQTHSVIRQLCE